MAGGRLVRLDANYQHFGRDSLKDFPLADVQLFLSSKQLALDALKGRQLTDNEAQQRRLLILEVQDISGWVRSQVSCVQQSPAPGHYRSFQQQPQQQYKPTKDFDRER